MERGAAKGFGERCIFEREKASKMHVAGLISLVLLHKLPFTTAVGGEVAVYPRAAPLLNKSVIEKKLAVLHQSDHSNAAAKA